MVYYSWPVHQFDTGRDCICTPNANFRYVVGALVMQHLFSCQFNHGWINKGTYVQSRWGYDTWSHNVHPKKTEHKCLETSAVWNSLYLLPILTWGILYIKFGHEPHPLVVKLRMLLCDCHMAGRMKIIAPQVSDMVMLIGYTPVAMHESLVTDWLVAAQAGRLFPVPHEWGRNYFMKL